MVRVNSDSNHLLIRLPTYFSMSSVDCARFDPGSPQIPDQTPKVCRGPQKLSRDPENLTPRFSVFFVPGPPGTPDSGTPPGTPQKPPQKPGPTAEKPPEKKHGRIWPVFRVFGEKTRFFGSGTKKPFSGSNSWRADLDFFGFFKGVFSGKNTKKAGFFPTGHLISL